MRVFHDRLTTDSDREYLKNILVDFFESLDIHKEEVLTTERVIFADFLGGRVILHFKLLNLKFENERNLKSDYISLLMICLSLLTRYDSLFIFLFLDNFFVCRWTTSKKNIMLIIPLLLMDLDLL